MNKETRDLILELTTNQEMLIAETLGKGAEYQRLQDLANRFATTTKCIENVVLHDGPICVAEYADATNLINIANKPYIDEHGYADKRSALHSLMHDVATEYPFLINYEDSGELLTYFATLLMNYSNHDKRDVELRLEEVEHLYKIRWCLIADHEILDCGDYIIDKDVPF